MNARNPVDTTSPAHHRLYGRAKGRQLTEAQSALMAAQYPKLAFDADEALAGEVWLEIGFGAAHHLLHAARSHPDVTIIGAEPFLNGVAKAVAGAVERDLDNLRLHHGNAIEVMAALPDASLSRIFLLFPDPWPKARHNKRRLVQDDFLADVVRLLRPGGIFRFASDITDYVDWTLVRAARTAGLAWSPRSQADFLSPPAGWPGTNFEAKAHREGRVPHFIDFTKSG